MGHHELHCPDVPVHRRFDGELREHQLALRLVSALGDAEYFPEPFDLFLERGLILVVQPGRLLGDAGKRVQVVKEAQVALHRPLGVGLRQPSRRHAFLRRQSLGDGIDVRRGAANVHEQQLAEPFFAVDSISDELRRFQNGGRRRHGDLGDHLPDGGNALGVRDAADEEVPYLFVDGVQVETAEFRHDVFSRS